MARENLKLSKSEAIGLASAIIAALALPIVIFSQELHDFIFSYLSKYGASNLILILSLTGMAVSFVVRIIYLVVSSFIHNDYSNLFIVIGEYTYSSFLFFMVSGAIIMFPAGFLDWICGKFNINIASDFFSSVFASIGYPILCIWYAVAVWKDSFQKFYVIKK
jgi:hypothetical protein